MNQTVTFLNLLKRYPCLHVPSDLSDKEQIQQRKDAFDALMKNCSAARLGIRDQSGLKKKFYKIRATFGSALKIYKARVRPDKPLPESHVPWFDAAHFLDTTGYLRRLTQSRARAKKTTNPAPRKTKVPARRAPTAVTNKTTAAKRATRANTVSYDSIKQVEVRVNDFRRGVKMEEEDEDAEEGEYMEEDYSVDQKQEMEEEDDEDEEEEPEAPTYHRLRPAVVISPPPPHSPPVVIGRVQGATRDPLELPVPTRPKDCFAVFLEYTTLRTQDYTPRQKREVINALSSAMNRIDDENDAKEDYSIQMFNSYNEFTNEDPLPKEWSVDLLALKRVSICCSPSLSVIIEQIELLWIISMGN